MSETNPQAPATDPQPNAPSVDPPAPAPPPPAPAPDPEPAPAPEPTPEEKQRDEEGRRVAQLRARLGAAERERERQAAELEYWRAQAKGAQPAEETPEQAEMRLRETIRAEEAGKIRAERFHMEGAEQFKDWRQRCDDLVAMGADANFAQLLVEMPGGVRVAAALAADPEEVQRIANIRTERGRAIALGAYAARTEGNGTQRPPAAVTRAPAPVRPVAGRASPVFNEYTASAAELVDHYLRPTKH